MLSKKLSLLGLTATALLALGACGADNNDSSNSSSASSTTEVSTTESSADVVSTASISDDPTVLEKAMSADGNWIVAATGDVTFSNDVTIAGEFHDKDDASADIYRKIALYSQDDDRNVTAEYTVTVPTLIVESENTNIVHGTIKGDVLVKANGFVLDGAKVEGNVTFEKQEYQDSAKLDENDASVTGDVTVSE
ncbi:MULTISPECIES: polymer-forming cytoskeletal protein [Enterococcus]|uniref:Polymer-forming cytoskeletal protein n=1 Tax=Candidatus Enterococcus mangumiae TaxID=2230878 RepID=A0ABZ2SSR9_9ENTE|nr:MULTISPECIES: polymer-forming cytoskeletal protein [unclassified Enterococcus]MBO0462508.1 polymer-forming cytoskeletal protein [Enterococcus sp. DIV1298c]MBO0488981.1 polymer-forming cytoskeletal protein [Enterococcus sp. DIV1094]MBO1300230.1 polymer-forming cytoskeletal protein [Enterococcus sp. DIV1271a]